MNVLIIGGSGHVGTIIRPAVAAEHDCTWFDIRPIEGVKAIVGSVNDDTVLRPALEGRDAVVYLAMGSFSGKNNDEVNMDSAFDVNTKGWYRTLRWGLAAGVRKFIYASSLSVYQNLGKVPLLDESHPADAWHVYGFSKRLSEATAEAAAQKYPDAVIIALRLTLPASEAQWPLGGPQPKADISQYATGPKDLGRLFVLSLACNKPGGHIVQTSGDRTGEKFPNTRVNELVGWMPRGE